MLARLIGYFDIPWRISTKELDNKLGISDQAVTERLRRGTSMLLEHTVMVEELRQAAESGAAGSERGRSDS